MRSGWWRGSSGVVAGSDRIDTAGQLSKQILGAVAGIFQGDGRESLTLMRWPWRPTPFTTR